MQPNKQILFPRNVMKPRTARIDRRGHPFERFETDDYTFQGLSVAQVIPTLAKLPRRFTGPAFERPGKGRLLGVSQ